MQEFEKITVTHSHSIELIVDNPTNLKLIGKGAHGAVFKLSGDKCVKIYADADIAAMETDAYRLSQSADIIPKLYESGINYVVMEYIEGVSLLELLSYKKKIPFHISNQLIDLFKEMQRIGFTQLDSSLRHIIIAPDGRFMIIDLVHSYSINKTVPSRALTDLNNLSLLQPFLNHLKEIDRELYDIWYPKIPKFTNKNGMCTMEDYKQIRVTLNDNGKLDIENPGNLPLIGLGGHGAVFKIDEQKCIKIYTSGEIAENEKQAYLRTLGSPIMPILYEIGDKYLVIEYINGPNLKDFLLLQEAMPRWIVQGLVNMFLEMERLCFLRRDESLRHILIKNNEEIKVIDHYYAFTLYNPAPLKMFKQLEEIKMLEAFIQEGSIMSPMLFKEFRRQMPEFF